MNSQTVSLLAQANNQSAFDCSVTEAEREFSTSTEAAEKFLHFRKKLLDVANWEKLSLISHFELHEQNGTLTNKSSAEIGNFIKITLPGSGKSDWVRVINIVENETEIILTVKPCFDPTDNTVDKASVSHFFTDESSNNFCLVRENQKIIVYVIGLSEKSNTEETAGTLESVRNFLTANIGYFLGIQKSEWKTFCRKLLEVEEKN